MMMGVGGTDCGQGGLGEANLGFNYSIYHLSLTPLLFLPKGERFFFFSNLPNTLPLTTANTSNE